MQTSIDDVAHTTPIYSLTEAAQIVRAPSTSFARWSHGHRFRQRAADAWGWSEPILTGVSDGRGYTVPFNALAEGYVVETFRRAGLPMARIRPAIDALRKEIGVEYALLSERLRTDGAEILIENGDRELVAEFLQTISYRDGFVDFLRLPAYERAEVVVDPRRNSGRPTIARIGVTVEDVVSRVRAGERMRDVASDFALEDDELRSILVQAA